MSGSSSSSAVPTLFLGTSATINGSEFAFSDTSVVTAPTPVNPTDVPNKIYVDELVQSQADRIDAILSGSSVNLDSLKEIVDFANTLNASEQASLSAAVATISTNITTLQSYVDSTKSDLQASDVSILSAVASETSQRTLQDAALNANIVSVSNSFATYSASNDVRSTAIEASVVSEAASRVSGDNTLQANINSLQTATENAATALEASLKNYIDAADASEASVRELVDNQIIASVQAEGTRAGAAEAALQAVDVQLRADLTSETASRVSGDVALQSSI